MRILLLGKDGQVGSELQRSLADRDDLIACGRAEADLAQPEALRAVVRRYRPQVIINAAAYTAVDQAEIEPALAFRINAEAPGVLAEEAETLGAWLVHYSTDYVFDGSGSRPWLETDATGPLNVYGVSKRAGEEAVMRSCSRPVILRTSWVYALQGDNFASKMLQLAQARDELAVVNDQVGAPTGASLLATITAHILPRLAAASPASLAGIYHAAAAGETSWCDYARFVLQEAMALGVPLRATPDRVRPVPSSRFPQPARRPANSRLDCGKLTQTFGLQLPDWRPGVARMLRDRLSG